MTLRFISDAMHPSAVVLQTEQTPTSSYYCCTRVLPVTMADIHRLLHSYTLRVYSKPKCCDFDKKEKVFNSLLLDWAGALWAIIKCSIIVFHDNPVYVHDRHALQRKLRVFILSDFFIGGLFESVF